LLIPSWDPCQDLWTPFFNLLWRHWPDCPYPVYLGANHLSFPDPRVTTLFSGEEKNWSTAVIEMLESLATPYVLLCLEDFFLRRAVSTAQIESCLDALSMLEGTVVRLVCRPGPDHDLKETRVMGAIVPGAPYRVSAQPSIWNRRQLLSLLRRGESIWQFELNGTKRSCGQPTGFYSVIKDIFPYGHHVVYAGKWFPWEAFTYRRANIGCDFSRRPTMSAGETARYCVLKSISMGFDKIPWRKRLRLKTFLKRVLSRLGLRNDFPPDAGA
jgi:hypothetical protein